jgi:hypothetical protein
MSNLKLNDRYALEKLLNMSGGYVLNFSNNSLSEFFSSELCIDIYDSKYSYGTGSKANRVRKFWEISNDAIVAESIMKMLKYVEAQKVLGNFDFDFHPELLNEALLQKAQNIANELFSSKVGINVINEDRLTREFAKEQLEKCKKKIIENDFSGVITNARSLLEDVMCKEIYKQVTGTILESKGNLIDDWKELAKKLNLDAEKAPDEFLKQILRGLGSIVQGLASMRNKMSDGHSPNYKSERHHAVLAINSALTIIEFLFDTLEFQNLTKNKNR